MAGESIPQLTTPSGHGETVLVIEDDDQLRGVLKKAFTRFDYQVLEATCVGEALQHWIDHRPKIKLIVSDNDLNSPGIGLLAMRRFAKEQPQTLCILASGSLTPADMEELHATTRIRCLPKPYTLTELFALVRKGID